MIRLIAVAFALALATSAQAMSPAPLHQQPDGMTTPVAYGCGPAGHGLMVSAWPELRNAKSAGARCGVQGTFAVSGFIKTPTELAPRI